MFVNFSHHMNNRAVFRAEYWRPLDAADGLAQTQSSLMLKLLAVLQIVSGEPNPPTWPQSVKEPWLKIELARCSQQPQKIKKTQQYTILYKDMIEKI